MSTNYGPRLVTNGLYFYAEGHKGLSNRGNEVKNLVGGGDLTKTNFYHNSSGFFEAWNVNVSGTANTTGFAKTANIADLNFALTTGKNSSAFVTFNNTIQFAPTVPGWTRQYSFAWGSDSTYGQWGFHRIAEASGGCQLRIKFDQNAPFGDAISFGDVPIGAWTQLAFVNDGNFIRLYKNGVEVNALNLSTRTMTGIPSSFAALSLGCMNNNGPTLNYYGFNGYIANAGFYTRALSPQEVQQNFQTTQKRFNIQ